MGELDRQLDRLGHGWRATRGRALVQRGHLFLLSLLVLGALSWRLLGVPAFLGRLDGRYVTVFFLGIGLLLLGPLLALLVPRFLRVPPRALARSLDDAMTWHDALDTAMGVTEPEQATPVETFLVVQSAGRLRGLEPKRLWPHRMLSPWVSRVLVVLFVALLVLPGMRGDREQRGAGSGEEAGIGQTPEPEPLGATPVDVWLVTHVQEPLPAEPLLPEPSLPEDDR
jgi:hypothetical protein